MTSSVESNLSSSGPKAIAISKAIPQRTSQTISPSATPQRLSSEEARQDVEIAGNETTGTETAAPDKNSDDEDIAAVNAEQAEIHRAIAQLTEGDFHQRWDRAKRFSKRFADWGDRVVIPLIQQLHSQQDVDTQWFLVRVLSQFDRPDVVKAIAHILVNTRSETLQLEACKALTTLGGSTIETLSGLLHPNSPTQQRRLAAYGLSHIRRSATIAPLLSITTDSDADIRAIAVEALGSFHAPTITPVLLNALDDEPEIALEAIRALGRRRDLLTTTDVVSRLTRCLHHTSATVARESATALGRLGDQSATAALSNILSKPVATPTKIAAIRALSWIGTAETIYSLIHGLNQDDITLPPLARQEIIKSLGQTREDTLKPIAARPLIQLLKAQTPQFPSPTPDNFLLKQTLITALTQLSIPDAIDALIPTLADPDQRIQMHALSALTQIDPRISQTKVQQYLTNSEIDESVRTRIGESLKAW